MKDNPHGQEHLDVVHNENVLPRLLTVNERGTLETDNIRPIVCRHPLPRRFCELIY